MDQLEGFEDCLFMLIDNNSTITDLDKFETEFTHFANHTVCNCEHFSLKCQQITQTVKKLRQSHSFFTKYKPSIYIVICMVIIICLNNSNDYPSIFILTFCLSTILVLLFNDTLIQFKNNCNQHFSITGLITSNQINGDCCICLDSLNSNPYTKNVVTKCGHYFHYKCLRSWVCSQMEYQLTNWCPICRKSI